MSIKIGFLGVAHLHAAGLAATIVRHPEAVISGVWDRDPERSKEFASQFGSVSTDSVSTVIEACDAVVVTSENVFHAELAIAASRAGKHVLCEKPLATTIQDADAMIASAAESKAILMTAFPCPFSPAFQAAQRRVKNGEIGPIRAVCATNRGTCPHDWFVDKSLSGGGAMIDHTVHVADLFRRLLGSDPKNVVAQTGNKMYGQDWEDTAMLSLTYADGRFATLDSSWSRLDSYKTWGDVTLNIVGETGVIEVDLFGSQFDLYALGAKSHSVAGYATDLNRLMVQEFLDAIREGRAPSVTGEDGRAALAVALAGYASLA